MSKIIAPYPCSWYDEKRKPAHNAMWWRFRLLPNADNNLMIMQVDNPDQPTWMSWEFFDGETTIIDAGMDRPTVDQVQVTYHHDGGYSHYDNIRSLAPLAIGYIDILCVEQPTPSPYWRALTAPGDWHHPHDDDPHCTPSRHQRWRDR